MGDRGPKSFEEALNQMDAEQCLALLREIRGDTLILQNNQRETSQCLQAVADELIDVRRESLREEAIDEIMEKFDSRRKVASAESWSKVQEFMIGRLERMQDNLIPPLTLAVTSAVTNATGAAAKKNGDSWWKKNAVSLITVVVMLIGFFITTVSNLQRDTQGVRTDTGREIAETKRILRKDMKDLRWEIREDLNKLKDSMQATRGIPMSSGGLP